MTKVKCPNTDFKLQIANGITGSGVGSHEFEFMDVASQEMIYCSLSHNHNVGLVASWPKQVVYAEMGDEKLWNQFRKLEVLN